MLPTERILRNRGRLAFVRPELRAKVEELLRLASTHGWDLVVTQWWRSDAQQEALYALGRTAPGSRADKYPPLGQTVTNARTAADSAHGRGAAVDLAFFVDGQIVWDGQPWAELGALGKSLGLEWGGDFPSFDGPHFQLAGWKALPPWKPEV